MELIQICHSFTILKVLSVLNILKDFKVLSRFIQKWIQPPACSEHGLLYLQAIIHKFRWFCRLSQCCGPSSIFVCITVLLYYCITVLLYPSRDLNFAGNCSGFDCGLLVFFKRAVIQRTIVDTPAFFLEHSLAEKIAVCAHTTHVLNKWKDYRHFCMKRLRTLKSFQIIKTETKKSKTYSGWWLFKGPIECITLMKI
jgi:hypothetical protein